MDKDNNKQIGGGVHMSIAKEPKTNIHQNDKHEHKLKVSKSIQEVTAQHSKLLKKLAE